MNWYQIFYWLTVADNAGTFFGWMCTIFTAIAVISTIAYFLVAENEDRDDLIFTRKWIFWSYPFMALFWILYVFTPSKKDSLLIIAGGGTLEFLTTDSTAKQIPAEMTNFVLTELKSMAKEAEVQLDTRTTKEQILEEAKDMTTEELLNKMSVDSNFAKVVLGK